MSSAHSWYTSDARIFWSFSFMMTLNTNLNNKNSNNNDDFSPIFWQFLGDFQPNFINSDAPMILQVQPIINSSWPPTPHHLGDLKTDF